ncbi:nose resistant to fluoxetine protein 6-like [Pollicipes pollicipes]|uniref:nose resistant to fluoxetine protein 6-like n=1 Tax=Pollicipes pollicipes TaxID=41117 RepID=UPI001884F0A6|nr:nose resistant to fluoxetine protein 6-like [Pollicipes pollicipes]
MAGLWTVLLTALCLAQTGSTHYSHSVRHSTRDWPWVNPWTQLLLAKKDFDRQESLLHGQGDRHAPTNLSRGVPTKMELEFGDDTSAPTDAPEGPSRRDQAIAKAIGPYISPIANANISPACLDSTLAYLLNILNKQWALQMFDATGKMPDGVLAGNLSPWGNWDECLNITAHFNATDILGVEPNVTTFTGKYCLAFLSKARGSKSAPLFKPPPAAGVALAPFLPILPDGVDLDIGMCIPSTCTSEELTVGLNMAFMGKVTAGAPDFFCYTKDDKTELSAGAIVMTTILSLTGLLMLVGTTVDIVAIKAAQDSEALWARVNIALQRTLPALLRRVFLAFSVYTNGRKLLDTSSTRDTLSCLHGIRFLSNTWVILGHTYYFLLFFKHQNITTVYTYLGDVAFQAISNATVSVDSFFFLSGLLVAYIAIRSIEKSHGKLNIVMFYVHRYIRLTPVMMLIIGFISTLYAYLGTGPYWGAANMGTPQICRDNWWTNMLYINNLVDMDKQCVGQTWYLANDMQMFIFSPLVLLPLHHWPKLGQLWIIFLVCFFTGINAMVTAVHKIGLPGGDSGDLRYMKPWTRAGPYLVGLYMGWILHKIRGRKIHLPAPVVAIGWITASLTGCLIVYGMYGVPSPPPKTLNLVYAMLNRTAWSICLAWVVFACVTGYGGFVNTLLSWKAFIPLSKLTYTSYLVSIDVQVYYWYTNKAPVYLSQTFIVYQFLASLPIIFAVAAIFSLAFESPMIALEKIIFPQPSRAAPAAPARQDAAQPLVSSTKPGRSGAVNAGFEADGGVVEAKQAGTDSAPENITPAEGKTV